jgi:hypothetical protein
MRLRCIGTVRLISWPSKPISSAVREISPDATSLTMPPLRALLTPGTRPGIPHPCEEFADEVKMTILINRLPLL